MGCEPPSLDWHDAGHALGRWPIFAALSNAFRPVFGDGIPRNESRNGTVVPAGR